MQKEPLHTDRTYKAFISYRRKNNALADTVYEILIKYFGESKVFMDREKEDAGHFWKKVILPALEQSEYFILLVTEASFAPHAEPDIYFEEIETALKHNLCIIPVVYTDGDNLKEANLPERFKGKELGEQNRIYYNEHDRAFIEKKLCEFMHVPYSPPQHGEKPAGVAAEQQAPHAPRRRQPRHWGKAAGGVLIAVALALGITFVPHEEAELPPPPAPQGAVTTLSVRTQAGALVQAVDKLLAKLPPQATPLRVGVGMFPYDDTAMLTPCSAALRRAAEDAVSTHGKVEWVDRKDLERLETEHLLPISQVLNPGALLPPHMKGLDAVLRGRYTWKDDCVQAELELVSPGGNTLCGQVAVPLASLLPAVPSAEAVVLPQNLADSAEGIRQTTQAAERMKHSFGIQLKTVGGERCYGKGQRVSFRIRAERDCHVAVICHQNDGNSVLLFPNSERSNTHIPGGTWVEIPGTDKEGFEIEIDEPFGSDVVQVLACTNRAALEEKLRGTELQADGGTPYKVLSRGMVVKKVNAGSADASAQWGEAHLIISTYP